MNARRKKRKNRKSLKWFKDLIISLFPFHFFLPWICVIGFEYCIQFIAQWMVTAVMHFIHFSYITRNMKNSTWVLECGLECVVLSKFSHFLKFSHELFDFGRIIFYSWHFLFETSVTASHKPTLNLKVEHLEMMNIEMDTLIHTNWSQI